MKLSFGKIFRKLTVLVAGLFFLSSNIGQVHAANAANGEALFKQYCAACHHPEKVVVGPALKGAKDRWKKEASEELYYEWIRNNQKLISDGVPYAVKVFEANNKSAMNLFTFLTNEQIDDITEYVETYAPAVAAGPTAGGPAAGKEEEDGGGMLWLVLIIGLLVLIPIVAQNFNVIFALNRLRQEKENEERTAEGKKPRPILTFTEMVRAWAWKNMGVLSVIAIILLFGGLVQSYGLLKNIGVYEGYHPSQPIKFPHYVHAGVNQIHCEYCHNSASKSKHAGLPTVNVCMNCHKAVQEGALYGKEEIGKIHVAAGFDVAANSYTGETKPIAWNRVYVLPDHVYFNHAQHVTVAGLKCQNCHGKVEEMETAYLIPVNEAEKPDIIEKPLTRPTLTMGWCIECHGAAKVQLQDNGGYYEEIHERLKKRPDILKKYKEDGNFTVEELGGWECSKCHY
jgi:mono/diheme cytochrome c family protein